MEVSDEQLKSWVESWSWRIPRGPQHGGMSGDVREWWSLTIWRRNDHTELQLDVNRLRPTRGSEVHTFTRCVRYEHLRPVPDYRTTVARLNLELGELFTQAGIKPPRLPDGSLSGDSYDL
ncbi:hypothetical protein [Kibdelosporangium phytohabitans]|uniref:Uncharacterized protein n=1 Tax=Kibdelosporangium phytohabitans TaxID=860235 RepID=A0A0N9HZJ4_9PSEU|nr:hypothetical protein [Kibdelosporangium phytohabitans]ALG07305.1 hypothetical protein AOZ06_10570 [Kibdelosporangium phytohabitans]MBE1471828.1 hypothetical protein [Kibdelosporangium phytohabitans]